MAANWRAPKILGGTPGFTVDNFEVTSNWSREIVIDGSLTIKMSTMAGSDPGALTGDGTLIFDSGTSPTGTHGVSESFGVKTKTVYVYGNLTFQGSGQIGYDAGGGGTWIVVNSAVMYAAGTHALGSNIDLIGEFTAGNLTLNHAGAADPGWYNLKSFTVNSGALLIEEDRAFNLNGTKFIQNTGTTKLEMYGTLLVGDNTAYADGGTAYDKNISITGGTVKMYPKSTFDTLNGDIRFSSYAILDVYSPASWKINNVTYYGDVSVSALGENRTATFRDNTEIHFHDYSPTGATEVVQNGVIFISAGNLVFADSTAISLRYGDNFAVVNSCGINSSATISASGTPTDFPDWYSWVVIQCLYGTLTGTFASHGSPPTGWSWAEASPSYGTSSLTFSWLEN